MNITQYTQATYDFLLYTAWYWMEFECEDDHQLFGWNNGMVIFEYPEPQSFSSSEKKKKIIKRNMYSS